MDQSPSQDAGVSSQPPLTAEPTVSIPGGQGGSGFAAVESLAVLVIGAVLMSFIYAADVGTPASERGAPGHDSFYHVKMAVMMPQQGLVDEFPWLQFSYFTDEGHNFVSHHYGFHMLLVPFVYASHWLTGDYLTGARWAIATTFGLTLMLFNLLLISASVRWRWLWLLFFLVMPFQFFTRHAYIRAISPSLMFMLLIILLMFRRRFVLTGLAVACYTHLYLGGVLYAPLVVGLYVVSSVLGPRDDRNVPWRLIFCSVAGWTVGVLTHPYSTGIWDFLKLQVFGSGLSPDISVGREWKPYEGVWWFAQMSGPILIIWAIAVGARLRHGRRVGAKELALLLINFAFLALTFKARRFIEYWPVFCLLSAAYLVAPLTDTLAAWFDRDFRSEERTRGTWIELAVTLPIAVGMVALAYRMSRSTELEPFLIEWPTWTALTVLYMLVPLAKACATGHAGGPNRFVRIMSLAPAPLGAALFVGLISVLARYGLGHLPAEDSKLSVGYAGWGLLAGLYVVVIYWAARSSKQTAAAGLLSRGLDTLRILVVGVVVLAGAVGYAAYPWSEVQRKARCGYDLPAIREAMTFLKDHSQPGDVVFTDDWDIFPVYFYYNSDNHYIVGLDPKFTHARRPELWKRYVKVSRGQVPADVYVEVPDESGALAQRQIHVQLEDIRDHFGAGFVITDRDHQALAAKLARAKDFAELIYPSTSYAASRTAPYLIFRVRDPGAAPSDDQATEPPTPAEANVRYLSSLTPTSVTQGWGDLVADQSVGGGPIHVGDREYDRGLGTHAPSRLVYAIPPDYDVFESVVGVNRSTGDRGSFVASVSLDGERVFRTSILFGESDPVGVRIPLGDARELTLTADPTDDGKRFDHVDWADARFVREPAEN